MTSLSFEVRDVRAGLQGAAPHLLFGLRVRESSGETVHAIALRCQLRIEPQRRHYAAREQHALTDLFGAPDRYAATLKPFLWTHASTMVQGFQGERDFDLPVACTYDFEVGATKYLHALRDGQVPLVLLFSGTVFTRGTTGFAVEQLSWSLEASCGLPVATWRGLMDHWFPGSSWIRLDRATVDALGAHRSARGLLSWDEAVADLLGGVDGAGARLPARVADGAVR